MSTTPQGDTIARIEETMRKWIETQMPIYEKLPPAQQMTTTQGEKVLKANPALQEIRSAFKDYCYVVKVQKEIKEEEPAEVSSLEELKKKFRVG